MAYVLWDHSGFSIEKRICVRSWEKGEKEPKCYQSKQEYQSVCIRLQVKKIWPWPTVIANEIMSKWDLACVLAQAAVTNYHRLGA